MGAPRLAREKRLVALLAVWEGATWVEAAGRAGISRRSVARLVAEAGGMKPQVHKPRPGVLTPAERESISRGLAAGESLGVIARGLERAPSTISREVAANGGRLRYRAWRAQRRADELAARPKPGWTVARPALWALVQDRLREWWSPRQIARWLRREFPEGPEWWVSHEAIYQAIFVQARGELRRQLAACLRSGRAQRRPQARAARAKAARQGPKIKDMVMISERPAEADDRAIPGHWEGDLILGRDGKSQVATLVERTTRFGFLIKVDSKDAAHVAQRIAAHVQTLPAHLRRSLTWDQGTEMAHHQDFTIATGIPVYFCDPHAPWMRGSNENWNGLVRQYLPKGTSLRKHSQDDLDAMARSLNGRPRETLGWHTPAEKLDELLR
jgi:transposase, IS30 family